MINFTTIHVIPFLLKCPPLDSHPRFYDDLQRSEVLGNGKFWDSYLELVMHYLKAQSLVSGHMFNWCFLLWFSMCPSDAEIGIRWEYHNKMLQMQSTCDRRLMTVLTSTARVLSSIIFHKIIPENITKSRGALGSHLGVDLQNMILP